MATSWLSPLPKIRGAPGVLLPVLWAASFSASPGATVAGRVIDQHGKPVDDAKVTLSLVDRSGVFPSTQTDAGGHFVFPDVFSNLTAPQWVDVEAEKEEDFLISPRVFMLGFPAGGQAPRFLLHPHETVANLTIRFGPPGGRLVIRFAGDETNAWHLSFKYRISHPGQSPPVDLAFRKFDVLVPAGDYELQIFDLSDRLAARTTVSVASGRTAVALVDIPAHFIPKKAGR